MSKMAILIDGAFFLKRYASIYPERRESPPETVATQIHRMALAHLKPSNRNAKRSELYRIFFYDCPPLTKRVHTPISNRALNFQNTPEAIFRTGLHKSLIKQRLLALRLGRLSEKNGKWQLKPAVMDALMREQRNWADLTDGDFKYTAKQTGVDMRIGVDITLLAQKKLVDQIVLIAGDSDFVPAAKQARREGIDFILDPMWNHVAEDLHEHIDGLRSVARNPTT